MEGCGCKQKFIHSANLTYQTLASKQNFELQSVRLREFELQSVLLGISDYRANSQTIYVSRIFIDTHGSVFNRVIIALITVSV